MIWTRWTRITINNVLHLCEDWVCEMLDINCVLIRNSYHQCSNHLGTVSILQRTWDQHKTIARNLFIGFNRWNQLLLLLLWPSMWLLYSCCCRCLALFCVLCFVFVSLKPAHARSSHGTSFGWDVYVRVSIVYIVHYCTLYYIILLYWIQFTMLYICTSCMFECRYVFPAYRYIANM